LCRRGWGWNPHLCKTIPGKKRRGRGTSHKDRGRKTFRKKPNKGAEPHLGVTRRPGGVGKSGGQVFGKRQPEKKNNGRWRRTKRPERPRRKDTKTNNDKRKWLLVTCQKENLIVKDEKTQSYPYPKTERRLLSYLRLRRGNDKKKREKKSGAGALASK